MKILSEVKTLPLVVNCNGCSTKLEVEKSDVKRTSHDQRDGDADIVICPVCSREIWISISRWQISVKERD